MRIGLDLSAGLSTIRVNKRGAKRSALLGPGGGVCNQIAVPRGGEWNRRPTVPPQRTEDERCPTAYIGTCCPEIPE